MAISNATVEYLSRDQKEELADLADAVLAEHGAGGKAVDPVPIVTSKGIRLVYGRYGEAFDGLLRHKAGRFSLFCNLDRVEAKKSRRARFTIAHELGHYFIAGHRNALRAGLAPHHRSFCEYESKLFVEQQADCFASNLLLPREPFLKKAKSCSPGLGGVLSLSDHFDTSVTATAIRYASLGVTPCIVIKWNTGRFGWKWLAEDVYAAGYRKTIEEKAKVVPGSATDKAFATAAPPPERFFKSATTAAFWFPFVGAGSDRDVMLHEHAMPLGRFGVLTLLYPMDGKLSWLWN
jgi:hypothetical protein